MAISPVTKIGLYSTKQHREKVIDVLHDSGLVQVISQSDSADTSLDTLTRERTLLSLEHAISILEPHKPEEKIPFAEKVASKGKLLVTSESFLSIVSSYDYSGVASKIESADSELSSLIEKKKAHEVDVLLLEQWKNVDVSVTQRDNSDWKVIFAQVPSDLFASFVREMEETVVRIAIDEVASDNKFYSVIITLSAADYELFNTHALEFNIEEVSLPLEGKTPAEKINALSDDISSISDSIAKLERTLITSAAEDLSKLKMSYDYLSWQDEGATASHGTAETERTFMLTCWIQKSDIVRLEKLLSEHVKGVYTSELEIEPEEKVPVVIKNSALVRPFENVTSVYGLPKPNEIDPTVFLAPFFILFFALCLTDAGYGIVLALASFIGLKVFKLTGESGKLVKLMMYAGIVTFFVGALFGGWFGIESEKLPQILQNIQIVNPLQDVMLILGLSAGLGLIQIIFGVGIKVFRAISAKDYQKENIVDGLWFITLIAGTMYGVFSFALDVPAVASILMYIVIINAILIVLVSGTNIFAKKLAAIKEKEGATGSYYGWVVGAFIVGLPIRLVSGLLGLYSIVGYLSDVLSYSRLMALGLATGIIAMAINIIAVLVRDLVPVAGWVLMILLLVGGHMFNIAINVLGAYIHSGRLQFVEFFPKFIEGGGETFTPFKRTGKYVEVSS